MRRDHLDRAGQFLRDFVPTSGFYSDPLARRLLTEALKHVLDDCADAALERVARARRERRR